MAARSRAEYNAYMRVYMKARYYRRKKAATEQLGGACAVAGCGITRRLEIDHIDPWQKSFTLGSALAGWSEKRIQKELKKCQLLCRVHHNEKTIREQGFELAKGKHGTISTMRYCKPICDLCRAARNEYQREYKRRNKKEAGMKPAKRKL